MSDLPTTLRSLDPADREVDVHGSRAQADLARILASGPPVATSRPRPRRRLVLAGGTVAAAVAAVVAVPSVTGGDAAYASWTATPQGLSTAGAADAAHACRKAQQGGPGREFSAALASSRTAIAERRGVWTTVLLAGPDGFSALCITDESTPIFRDWFGSAGTPTGLPPTGPRDVVATDLGTGTSGAGDLSLAAGPVGDDVVGVAYRSPTYGTVTATVSGGRFALWLPGDELADAPSRGVDVAVTYRDGGAGTTRLHL